MKYIVLSFGLLSAMATLNSCENCYNCVSQECYELLTVRVCESDLPSGSNWDEYGDALENAGYSKVTATSKEVCDDAEKTAAIADYFTCTEK